MSNPSRWVLVKRFAEVTGYSENAVRHKVKGGIWLEGRIWRKAPDGPYLFEPCRVRTMGGKHSARQILLSDV